MRTRHLVAGLLAVMLAACSSGTSPAPSAAPSVEPTPLPTPTTAETSAPTAPPAPTSTTAGLSVKVTFDGETCTYVGPTVIPDGTVVRFEYVPDQGVASSTLLVYGIKPGTTWEMVTPPGTVDAYENIPDWVYQETASWIDGAGTLLYQIQKVKHGKDNVDYQVGGFHVACTTPIYYPAVQLSIAGA
jgi:hypothetical protein